MLAAVAVVVLLACALVAATAAAAADDWRAGRAAETGQDQGRDQGQDEQQAARHGGGHGAPPTPASCGQWRNNTREWLCEPPLCGREHCVEHTRQHCGVLSAFGGESETAPVCGCTTCIFNFERRCCEGTCQLGYSCTRRADAAADAEDSHDVCGCAPPPPTPAPTPAPTPPPPTPEPTPPPTPAPTPPPCGTWRGDRDTWLCDENPEAARCDEGHDGHGGHGGHDDGGEDQNGARCPGGDCGEPVRLRRCIRNRCAVLAAPPHGHDDGHGGGGDHNDSDCAPVCVCTSCHYDHELRRCGGLCQHEHVCIEVDDVTHTCGCVARRQIGGGDDDDDDDDGGGPHRPPPPSWTCAAELWDTCNGCDCDCGAPDPDCARPECAEPVFGCRGSQHCARDGTCVPDELDDQWWWWWLWLVLVAVATLLFMLRRCMDPAAAYGHDHDHEKHL